MAEEALILANNLQHNVLMPRTHDPQLSLMALTEHYFRTQVAGQAEGTLDAKHRDLACFLTFYVQLYGHDDGREWYKSVTEAFLKALARGQVPRPSKRGNAKPQRLSQSTVARTYATVRHFARWIHKHVAAFPLGCPSEGVKAPEEEEPKWKGLSRLEQLRLLNAAQTLRVRRGRGTHQGMRDHALLAALLGTGLRVSELLALDLAQYNGRGFVNVLRKGGHVQRFLPIQKTHREVLDEWLKARGNQPGPLFTTRSSKRLDRTQAFVIIRRIARQANAHLPPDQHLIVSPHVLRHTLLRKIANEKGVHHAMELSGHRSDRYIWRYVRPDEQSLADAIDELE
ncbi:MAG: tyrosine-type recombinase/integrase [Candidatus Entotheonellia bacterium]